MVVNFFLEEICYYVLRFIVVAYIINYYSYYGLKLDFCGVFNQLISGIKFYECFIFGEIVYVLGVVVSDICKLNLVYWGSVIFKCEDGYYLLLLVVGIKNFKLFIVVCLGQYVLDYQLFYFNIFYMDYKVCLGEIIGDVVKWFNIIEV